MSERLNLQDLIDLLAQKEDLTKKDAELFLREFIEVISETIEVDDTIRVKDFGTFKRTLVNVRKSVDVNTGEEIEIPAHYRFGFTPEKSLREEINKPFAHFESVPVKDGVTFEDNPEIFVVEEEEEDEEFLEDLNTTKEEPKKETETQKSNIIVAAQKASGIDESKIEEDTADQDMYSSEKMKQNISEALSRDREENPDEAKEEIYAEGSIEERIDRILNYQPKVVYIEKPTTTEELTEEIEKVQIEASTAEIVEGTTQLEETDTEIEEELEEEIPTSKEVAETPVSEEITDTIEETGQDIIEQPKDNALVNEELLTEEPTHNNISIEDSISEILDDNYVPQTNLEKEKMENQKHTTEIEEPIEDNLEEQSSDYEYDDYYYEKSSNKKYIYGAIVVLLVIGLFIGGRYYFDAQENADIVLAGTEEIEEELGSDLDSNAANFADENTNSEETLANGENPSTQAEETVKPRNLNPIAEEVMTKGQTLRLLAEKHYGNRSFWIYIYEENKSKISNPDNVMRGTRLTIPSLDKYNVDPKNSQDLKETKEKEEAIFRSMKR